MRYAFRSRTNRLQQHMHSICLFTVLVFLGACTCNRPKGPSKPDQDVALIPITQQPQKNTTTTLSQSLDLATNLQAAASLEASYQTLAQKFPGNPETNNDPSFVGMQGMKEALRNKPGNSHGNLKKFIAWAEARAWEQFEPNHHHYDWWMFPIDRASQGQGLRYTVYQQDIAALKGDTAWLKDYRLGAILLLQSWGWDVANGQYYPNPAPGQQWRDWDVRLGKLANSLILFGQWDLYASLKGYVVALTKQGIKLQPWVLNYFQ